MAGSVNKVILIGNLGKDPEIRRMGSGEPVVNLSVATSETWRDKGSGERRERTEWHRVVIFNEQLARVAESYLRKGSKVYLEGQLQTRKYEQGGVEKYTTEIVLQRYRGELTLLDSRGSGDPSALEDMWSGNEFARPSSGERRQGGGQGAGQGGGRYAETFDDDIPF